MLVGSLLGSDSSPQVLWTHTCDILQPTCRVNHGLIVRSSLSCLYNYYEPQTDIGHVLTCELHILYNFELDSKRILLLWLASPKSVQLDQAMFWHCCKRLEQFPNLSHSHGCAMAMYSIVSHCVNRRTCLLSSWHFDTLQWTWCLANTEVRRATAAPAPSRAVLATTPANASGELVLLQGMILQHEYYMELWGDWLHRITCWLGEVLGCEGREQEGKENESFKGYDIIF